MTLEDLFAAQMRAWFVRDNSAEVSSAEVGSASDEKREGTEVAKMLK